MKSKREIITIYTVEEGAIDISLLINGHILLEYEPKKGDYRRFYLTKSEAVELAETLLELAQ